MRKCIFYENSGDKEKGIGTEAFFHEWGSDYEQFESGAGNLSVGILELKDGSVKTIIPELIKFKAEQGTKK